MSREAPLSRPRRAAMLARPMFAPSPRATLFLLLGLAVVIFGGGVRLARQEQSVRLDRDREPLRRFCSDAQAALRRLDDLYESHLSRLARTLPNDAFEIRRGADRIVGVRQFSLLHQGAGGASSDLHVQITPAPAQRTPIPVLSAPRTGSTQDVVLLEPATLFPEDATASGWIDEPGKPLLFFSRRSSNEVAVLMIDPAPVEAALSAWFQKWALQSFEPVRAAAGPDAFRDRRGNALALSGEAAAGRPDLLLPVRSRLGAWELASWDRREIQVHYDLAALGASGVVSVLVGALGVVAFGQQRRASVLAAQRVSFVNQVSHELRSPLTNILLNADLAGEALEERPQEAARRLALLQEEARRLGRLIDNVLTFSLHEQGRRRSQPRACVPDRVLAAALEPFAPSFTRRALSVRCLGEAPSACLLDADALAQILSNLLSNVEKYVPGGVVEILLAQREGSLMITVADEGPGIPLEAAERIFRPFERLRSRIDEGAGGTGLGLAIARDLASAMGGTLLLRPSVRGARFELSLPAPCAARIALMA